MDIENKDFYFTLKSMGEEIIFKDRASKFHGTAFPVKNEHEIKEHLEALKLKHYKAGHFCYAWRLGKNYEHYRANDDGEPANSAGMPILGQLQAFEVTNVLVVVLRYFGGTKLGIGGLITAYKTAAKMALENSTIIRKTINFNFKLSFAYPEMGKVMRTIKEHDLQIIDQKLELKCAVFIAVRKKDVGKIRSIFENIHGVEITAEE